MLMAAGTHYKRSITLSLSTITIKQKIKNFNSSERARIADTSNVRQLRGRN